MVASRGTGWSRVDVGVEVRVGVGVDVGVEVPVGVGVAVQVRAAVGTGYWTKR